MKNLKVDEMLALAKQLDVPNLNRYVTMFESAGTLLGVAIEQKLGVCCTSAVMQDLSLGGLTMGFYPREDGQPCPPQLAQYDPLGDFQVRAHHDPPTN